MFILRFLFLSKTGLMITLAISFIGGFYGWLHMHDQSITDAATSAYNAMQNDIYQKKTEEYVKKTEDITNNAITIASDVNQQKNDLTKDLKAIEKKANDEAPDGQRPSSVYLKNIIKQLDINYGAKK